MVYAPHFDWHLAEWMTTLGIDQAELRRRTGWSKRKASDLYNGEQRYNRDTLNEAAVALNARPFELLLPYAEAMEFRSVKGAIELAAERRSSFTSEPGESASNGTS